MEGLFTRWANKQLSPLMWPRMGIGGLCGLAPSHLQVTEKGAFPDLQCFLGSQAQEKFEILESLMKPVPRLCVRLLCAPTREAHGSPWGGETPLHEWGNRGRGSGARPGPTHCEEQSRVCARALSAATSRALPGTTWSSRPWAELRLGQCGALSPWNVPPGAQLGAASTPLTVTEDPALGVLLASSSLQHGAGSGTGQAVT